MYLPKWLRWLAPARPIKLAPCSNHYQGIPFIAELPGKRRVYSTLMIRQLTPTSIYFTNGGKITAPRLGSLKVYVPSGIVLVTDQDDNIITSIGGGGSSLSRSHIEIG